MTSNTNLREIDQIKYRTNHFFDDIININNINPKTQK